MKKETRISVVISQSTRDLMERHVRVIGVKKGHLVEQALRHHLRALSELPAEVIIYPKIVVTRRSGVAILTKMRTGKATKALRNLMRDGD